MVKEIIPTDCLMAYEAQIEKCWQPVLLLVVYEDMVPKLCGKGNYGNYDVHFVPS